MHVERHSSASPAPVICIIGMHRAGTSLVADAIARLGVFLGGEDEHLPAAEDNPRGFFEHEAFVGINERLLERLGSSWKQEVPLDPAELDRVEIGDIRADAEALVDRFRSHGGPWGWKDPRTTILLPFWLQVVPELHFVGCVRHPAEVADSLVRRGDTGLDPYSSWFTYSWNLHELPSHRPCVLTHYDSWLQDARGEVERVAAACALDVTVADLDLAASAVERSLRHNESAGTDGLPPHVAALYRLLASRTAHDIGSPVEPCDHALAPAGAAADERLRSTASRLRREQAVLAERLRLSEQNAATATRLAAERQRQLAELQGQLAECSGQLQSIVESRGWRMLEQARRLRGSSRS